MFLNVDEPCRVVRTHIHIHTHLQMAGVGGVEAAHHQHQVNGRVVGDLVKGVLALLHKGGVGGLQSAAAAAHLSGRSVRAGTVWAPCVLLRCEDGGEAKRGHVAP